MEQIYCSAWGMASKGQLGCIHHSKTTTQAVRIPNQQQEGHYIEVACGENHNLLLTSPLYIHSCGSNTYGQLGIGMNIMQPFNQSQMNG